MTIPVKVLTYLRLRASTYEGIKYVVKQMLLEKQPIELGSPYEIAALNNYVYASSIEAASEYNIGEKITLVGEHVDPETGLIGESPIDEIWDKLSQDYNTIYSNDNNGI